MSVYFIREECYNGKTKIGYSVNPESRVKGLQTGNSNKLKIVGVLVAATQQTEKELHSYFYSKRVTGEWFDITNGDIDDACKKYSNIYKYNNLNTNENINDDVVLVKPISNLLLAIKWILLPIYWVLLAIMIPIKWILLALLLPIIIPIYWVLLAIKWILLPIYWILLAIKWRWNGK